MDNGHCSLIDNYLLVGIGPYLAGHLGRSAMSYANSLLPWLPCAIQVICLSKFRIGGRCHSYLYLLLLSVLQVFNKSVFVFLEFLQVYSFQ